VAVLRTDVSEEHIASIITVTRNHNAVDSSPILVALMMEVIFFSEMSVLARVKQSNIQEDDIPHCFWCLRCLVTNVYYSSFLARRLHLLIITRRAISYITNA
jgi:hypothetical protein